MTLTDDDLQLFETLTKRARTPRPQPRRRTGWLLVLLLGLVVAGALIAANLGGDTVMGPASGASTPATPGDRPDAPRRPPPSGSRDRTPPERRPQARDDRGRPRPDPRDRRLPPRPATEDPQPRRPPSLEDRLDDLDEQLNEMEEEIEDLSEPVGEFETFDQCMHFVGVTEYGSQAGASGYVYKKNDRVRRPAFEMDIRGYDPPMYQFMAFPGEEPPSIECNEDAHARPEND